MVACPAMGRRMQKAVRAEYNGAELGKSKSMRQERSDKPLVEALSGGVLSWSVSAFMAERLGCVTWAVVSEVGSGMVASERDAALRQARHFFISSAGF